MRLTITDVEFDEIVNALRNRQDIVNLLLDKRAEYESSITNKKRKATVKATKNKIEATKNKIENACNILRFENKTLTVAKVAKTAGVSYSTAKKYEKFITEQ